MFYLKNTQQVLVLVRPVEHLVCVLDGPTHNAAVVVCAASRGRKLVITLFVVFL